MGVARGKEGLRWRRMAVGREDGIERQGDGGG